MATRILIFFACLVQRFKAHTQILPLPGSQLNYTQVMFYIVQITEDTVGGGQHLITQIVKPGQLCDPEDRPDKQLMKSEKMEIKVSSKTNPDFDGAVWVVWSTQ